MDQWQRGRGGSRRQDSAASSAEMGGAAEAMDGLATTQEQVSDMYKMGTIEDRGSTR